MQYWLEIGQAPKASKSSPVLKSARDAQGVPSPPPFKYFAGSFQFMKLHVIIHHHAQTHMEPASLAIPKRSET